MRSLVSIVACAMALAGGAAAQDMSQTAAFGEEALNAGFLPDPHEIAIWPGGSIDASTVSSGCNGRIANAPDYQLTYSAGSSPLIFRAISDNDTTLVVNGPDARWYCNDDTNGLNPEIRFDRPQSGTYDVWIGTYGDSVPASTVLQVTEISTYAPPGSENGEPSYAPVPSDPNIELEPLILPDPGITATYGQINLRSGFTPDPRIVSLRAGGSIPASNVSAYCSGTIARAPDYQITYTAGRRPLIVRTHSDADTTLVIRDADGMWQCDDDSRGDGDAQVVFDKPSSGVYDIWVGIAYGRASAADLILTERE